MKKRIFSLFLCLLMIVTLLPTTAFAATHSWMVYKSELENGDILVEGTKVYPHSKTLDVYISNQLNVSNPSTLGQSNIKNYYTCSTNYYVVNTTSAIGKLYLYPLPTVTFDANGGSVSLTSKWVVPSPGINCTYGELPTPTRENYIFVDWYTEADGGSKVTSTTTVTQSTDHTLYARWQANTYTVTFNGNGATGGSTATQNFTYNAPQNLTANGFQQKYTVSYVPGEGLDSSSATATSTFNGWNTAANGSGTDYSNRQSVNNLTATNGGSVTLYAQWTKGSVTLPTPTKSGKVCTGWYTSSDTKVGDCGASYTPSGNITLHAKWETVGYTVTWKNYDGTVLETDEAVAQGTTPTYNGAIPTKPDSEEKSYAFSHWSPAISPVTGDIVYIAQFTEGARQYALTFAFDDGKGQLTGNEKAPVGSVVTVNPLPNNGYAVKDIIAYKTGDKSTSVSIDSNNYSFTMPAYDVTIEVTWVESDVIYTSAYKDVEPTFTVTIPASVTLGNEITVSAENVRVNKGYQVVVSAADVSGAGKNFTMTSTEGYTFAYSITVGGNAITSGANILTVNPDTASAGDVVLKFEKPQKAIYAGNYSGNVVFTIAVQPVGNDGN